MTTCCHLLSFVVTGCHLLSLAVTRCHLLSIVSLVVPLIVIRFNSLSFIVTRCIIVCLFTNNLLDKP